MSNLISVESAAELLGTSKTSLMVTACAYKRDKGKYPKWYISNGAAGAGRSWVNINVLNDNRQLVRNIWNACTDSDTGLYWIMSYELGMSDYEIAKQLAKRSNVFTNTASWSTFLSNSLFSLPIEVVYIITKTMLLEFLTISKRIITLVIRGRNNLVPSS